jgi:short-subunit dehydrogenase
VARPVTLITGASAGLGADFARACARRGEELVLVARRRDRLDALAATLGGRAHVLTADLAGADAPAGLVAQVEDLGLEVGTLINNAGFGLAGRFADLPLGRQLEMMDLNVRAVVELTGLVLPKMHARRAGAILNVASTAAFQPGPGMAVYFATKAFVLSFTEALHQEVAGTGIRVTALCPGPVATEFAGVAGMTSPYFDRFAVRPEGVVAAGLRALDRNRALVVPGWSAKLGAQAHRVLPRAVIRRIVAGMKI